MKLHEVVSQGGSSDHGSHLAISLLPIVQLLSPQLEPELTVTHTSTSHQQHMDTFPPSEPYTLPISPPVEFMMKGYHIERGLSGLSVI